MSTLTLAQSAALLLARRGEIRYYRGGWYSVPAMMGGDQRSPAITRPLPMTTVALGTLRSLVARRLLCVADVAPLVCAPRIYARRWRLTDEGLLHTPAVLP